MNTTVYTRYRVPGLGYVPGFKGRVWEAYRNAFLLVLRVEVAEFNTTLNNVENPKVAKVLHYELN